MIERIRELKIELKTWKEMSKTITSLVTLDEEYLPLIRETIDRNPGATRGIITGLVMRQLKGKGNPAVVLRLVDKVITND
jgi:Asp-tRNA(Asn)/Glu-tRNA(Gln) amidotransferase B subunit